MTTPSAIPKLTARSSSGLHSSSPRTGKVARWVCDRCGATIDKRKCSFDEAAADGYDRFRCDGACDHAEQTMRYFDN